MFLLLRHAAIKAMAGRKWYEGPVCLDLTYEAPESPGDNSLAFFVSPGCHLGGRGVTVPEISCARPR
jgi:hypothetical protein